MLFIGLFRNFANILSLYTVDGGRRYSLCNGTFLSLLIKYITTLAYSVSYNLSLKLLVVILAFL